MNGLHTIIRKNWKSFDFNYCGIFQCNWGVKITIYL